jgi:hypothetical protein
MKKIPVIYCILFIFCSKFCLAQETKKDTTKSRFGIDLPVGASLIRNTMAPNLSLLLSYNHKNKYEIALSGSLYYFFERDAQRNFSTYINSFVGVQFSSHDKKESKKSSSRWVGSGIAFLVSRQGDYFQGRTSKIYGIYSYKKIEILPEIYVTNNRRNIFPGLTVRF